MPLAILGITLFACFLLLLTTDQRSLVRQCLVNAVLIVSAALALLTEGLSFFGRLDRPFTIGAWSCIAAVCVIFVFYRANTARWLDRSNAVKSFIARRWRRVVLTWSLPADRAALAMLAVLLLGLLAVALTITNNYDSYSYHLPRVEQWIQNRNVGFFPTNFVPQVARNPLPEYAVLNLKLLTGSNAANNFVQFTCYLLSAVAISLIALELGASGRQQFYSAVLGLTVPMAMLQAETTQTDMVVSFLVLACVYYCVKVTRSGVISVADISALCLSIALGIAAKGTFYLFAFPFCLWFAALLLVRHRDRLALSVVMLVLYVALLDGPFLFRNYRTFGSPLGPGGGLAEGILNEEIGVRVILSNMIRDWSLHLTLPYDAWNRWLVAAVRRVHTMIGYSADDVRSTWYGPYRLSFMVWHDLLGSFIHLVLALWAGLVVVATRKKVDWLGKLYYASCVCGFIAFFAIMKWQLFNTRLDVVGVLLLAPMIVLSLPGKVVIPSSLVLLIIGNLIVYQFQWGGKAILSKEFRSYHGDLTYALNYEAARSTNAKLKEYGVEKVGFALHGNFPEWSYWLTSDNEQFRHVLFPGVLSAVPNFDSTYRYRALIIDKTCTVNGGDGCLVGGALNRFLDNNQDVALAEEFPNNSQLVIFKRDQSKWFLY